jgi:hypothetical protein
MCGHERDGVHEDPKLMGADSQCLEVELTDGGVRAKEVVSANGAAGDHDSGARQDEAGLGHSGQWEQEPGHLAQA